MLSHRKKQKESEKPGRTQFIMMFFAFSFGMILSNLIAQSSAQKAEEDRPPLFIYKGIDKSLDDVSQEFRERLLMLDAKKRETTELAALQLHVYQYAKDKGISPEQAGEELFPVSERLVEDQLVSQFYKDNQEALAKPFYLVEQEIRARLSYQKVDELKKRLLKSLKERGDLAILPNH